jgi:signal transduction histidine kinase
MTAELKGDDEMSKVATNLSTTSDLLERASQAQQSSEQRFDRLLSDASHQLRTPLTSILGFTEVLMRGAKDDPETALHVLKLIKGEAERMTYLINDLLLLARLEDAHDLVKQRIDLIDLALTVLEQTKAAATDGRKITVHVVTHERLNVQANADHLKQVLLILFDNAMKYGRPGSDGWIRLQLNREGGYALLQVIDNGKGIHTDDLPHIFERFYRGKHMPIYVFPRKVPRGAGLGLSIARAIVLAHQGSITVSSTPDKETIFTEKIPCLSQ